MYLISQGPGKEGTEIEDDILEEKVGNHVLFVNVFLLLLLLLLTLTLAHGCTFVNILSPLCFPTVNVVEFVVVVRVGCGCEWTW
jgi:hypothetical protein